MAANGLRTYDGAVALINGGASVIGSAIARELTARGATVVTADRQYAESTDVPAAAANT